MNPDYPDHSDPLKGAALKAQRFQMLEDIAKELAGEVIFPTYFDADLRLRKVLQDPNKSIADVTSAVALSPLISAKLLQLANSVAYNPAGQQIRDLKSAVTRLGLNTVRSTSIAIVITQLLKAKGMAKFGEMTQALWQHTVRTAAAARAIARRVGVNPDEAMMAGLVHDLGAFYMLYRATQYEDLAERPESLKYLILNWHEGIGTSLLDALGLPEEIVAASIDHDHLRPLPPAGARNLNDIVYQANILADSHYDWLGEAPPQEFLDQMAELLKRYENEHATIEQFTHDMLDSFA